MASIVGGPSGASVPGHARTGLKRGRILATIWIPGANPFNVVRGARGKSLCLRSLASRAISPGPRRCHDGGRRGLPASRLRRHTRHRRPDSVLRLVPNMEVNSLTGSPCNYRRRSRFCCAPSSPRRRPPVVKQGEGRIDTRPRTSVDVWAPRLASWCSPPPGNGWSGHHCIARAATRCGRGECWSARSRAHAAGI
jgi:hypothetical protein